MAATTSRNTPDIGNEKNKSEEQDLNRFEKSLDEVGFGMFQVYALLITFVSNVACLMVSGNTPFILPNAECDLSMNFMQKGLLIAITYAGMLTTGFFVGFIADAFGRKWFIVGCFACTASCVLVEGSAQNYYTLIFAKYFEGFFFNGALNANIAYMSEVTHRKIRDRVMLLTSSFLAASQIVAALMAWAILPQDWAFVLGNGLIALHSWNIFFFACGLWSITACLLFSLLPESPKFLYSNGRHEEAWSVLKRMYTINTGKPAESFPYTTHSGETDEYREDTSSTSKNDETKPIPVPSWKQNFVKGLKDVKPLFQRPLLRTILLMCFMQLMIMLGYNMMRLWYPQLSTIIESYSQTHNETGELCIMLDTYMANHSGKTDTLESGQECIPTRSGSETYINSLIMASASMIPYIISGLVVNLIGKKPLIFVAVTTSCVSSIALYWSSSTRQVMVLMTAVVALTQCCVGVMQTIVVEVFPTTFKTFSLSLLMSTGRIGSLLGNVTFPLMIERGCMVPFFITGFMMASVALLSIFLPGPRK